MIVFIGTTIEGFGSIVKPMNFPLNIDGLTIMRGRVGSGKTTVPSAMAWCLYGQTLKEKSNVVTWEEVRGKDFKGTKVSVDFKKGPDLFTVIRCEKYKGKVGKQKGGSRIIILMNGVDVIGLDNPLFKDLKGKREQQALIEKILGYSFDLFKSSIVFGQKMKRIIEETGPKKKKIFEEAFDAGFIEEAKNNEKGELVKLEGLFEKIENKLGNTADKLTDKRDVYLDAKKNEKNFKKEKLKRINELKEEKRELTRELSKIPTTSTIKNTKSLQAKIDKLEKKLEKAIGNNHKIKNIEKRLKDISLYDIPAKRSLIKIIPKNCSHCGQKLAKKGIIERKKSLKKEIGDLEKEAKKLKIKLESLQTKDISKIKIRTQQQREKLKALESSGIKEKILIERRPKIEEKIKRVGDEIKALEKEELVIKSTKFKKQISKLENTIKKQKKRRRLVLKEIKLKKWLINDPLSNNGIKAYIFSSLLGNVNTKLEEYSNILGFKVEFGIDLSTHNKDFYQAILYDDIVIPYQDLSGGQKQLVDTSIAFAIHDVISEIRPSNLMFMDEPFEGLGDEEIELVEELIETKAKGKSLYLITHHKSFNPCNANEIIFKRNKDLSTKII